MKWRISRIYFLAACFWQACLPCALQAIPLEVQSQNCDTLIANSRICSAEAALQTGLPTVAEHLFSQALEQLDLPPELKEQATLGLIDAYLAKRKFTEASSLLSSWEGAKTPRYALRAALVAYGNTQWKQFSLFLQECPPETLPESERSWVYLAQGLEAMHEGHPMAAETLLEKAKSTTQTPTQRSWVEALIDENKLLSGPVTEGLLQDLKAKTQTYRSEPAGPRFAEEYALALAASGKTDEALAALENELKRLPASAEPQESHLFFLMGTLGRGTEKGTQSFKRILEGKRSTDLQRTALYALASAEAPEAFEKTLNSLLEAPEPHPLIGDLLLLRAAFGLSKKQFDRAEADAKKALSLAPEFKITAFELLATIAWERAQYRTAADYLTQWRQEVTDAETRARLTGWVADCYFLARDFPQASTLYREAIGAAATAGKGRLAYQAVLADIQQDKLSDAAALLDTQPLSLQERWKAEWNLAEAFRQKNKTLLAHERLKSLQAKPDLEPALAYRFAWLEATLALESGAPAEAAEKAGNLVKSLKALHSETIPLSDRELLLTEALLLEGEALLGLNDTEHALKCFQALRHEFPNATAAPRSYLIEARMQAAASHTVEAQQRLIELVDTYPTSSYAPIALFEAAVLAGNRGIAQATQEALTLLERLAAGYPQSDLIVAARMEQGKLLCRLGDFPAAELLYTTLIPALQDKPERYPLMLARADCLLAQAATSPSKLSEASALLERIFDQPTLPAFLKSEAGYKWGFALESQKNTHRAEAVYWQLLLPIASGKETVAQAEGYWLARAAFALANILEAQDKPLEARKLYQLVSETPLPGCTLARSKLDAKSLF